MKRWIAHPAVLAELGRAAVISMCAAIAVYYAGSTAAAIWHYGWTELFQDQFRQYARLLSEPFPRNVLMPDNSHRQITSNLVRLADLHWRQGDQDIGVAMGLAMLLAVLASLWWRILGDVEQPRVARAAALLVATIGLMWMGSARMQFHGNEAFQIYLVMLCAVGVMLAVERMRLHPALGPALLGLASAAVALVSFGTGVAVSGLVVALMVVRRVELRWTLALSVVAVFNVIAYTFLMPGADGVHSVVSRSLPDIARNAATFLSSFWTSGWLSYADQGVAGVDAGRMATMSLGGLVVTSARGVFAATGSPTLLDLAWAIGCLGIVLLGWRSWVAWRHPETVGRIESLGLALALLVLGVATLVAIGRSNIFAKMPDQVLADRYVPWSALFWAGLLLAMGARLSAWRSGVVLQVGWAIGLAVLFYPSHRFGYGWAAAVEHGIERRAAQLQTGVFSEGVLSFMDMPNLGKAEASLSALKAHRSGIFRARRSRMLGETVSVPATGGEMRARIGGTVPVHEIIPAELPSWHVQGRLLDPGLRQQVDGVIVVDRAGRVVGTGEFGFRSGGGDSRRLDDMADGFDAYFRSEAPCEELRILGVDDDVRQVVPLGPVLPCALPSG